MILKNFLRLLKTKLFQTFATVLLLSFLVFFLNILIALTSNIYSFSNELKWKLWVYLYIKEWESAQAVSKSRDLMIDLQDSLRNAWLKVVYFKKEDAMKKLSKRLPKIFEDFEKYWIENPIPPTLYITFSSESQYKLMRDIVNSKKYQDILLNLSDIWDQESFKEQETRISKIIEFSNFLIKFYVFLSIVLALIILWFLTLILQLNFYSFIGQIEVEKLVWFNYFQIKWPFLFYTIFVILLSFALWLWYIYPLIEYLNVYFINVFDFDLKMLIVNNLDMIKKWVLAEIAVLSVSSLIVANVFLTRLIKKI